MATSKRVWNPAHHPRDGRGRFTKSATRVLKSSDAKRAKAAVAGFKPTDLGPGAANGKEWLTKQAAAGAAADDAVSRYFAGGWKTTHQELRTKKDAAQDPDVIAIDKAMRPLSDDVMLERRVSLKMFAHIPLEQLQGMKVRDAAYQPTALQGSQGEAPDGMVTIHMAVPAGTRAVINPDTGAIVLDRDTETAISRVEPNGRGGYDLYGVVIPRQGAAKPGRPAGEPAQGDQGDQGAPDGPDSTPDDGGTPEESDQDTAGPAAAGGTTTPPRKRAAKAAAGEQDDGQDTTGGPAQPARKAAASTAGTRAPSDDDGDVSRAGDDDDVQGADAAAALDELEQQVEQGRPVTAAVADLETGAYARIEGEDQYGTRTRLTGYVTARPALVTVKKNRRAKTGEQMLSAYVTETPNGANGWRGQVLVAPDATAEILPEPDQYARRPGGQPADGHTVDTVADVQRNDYITVTGRDGSNNEITATGYAGAVVPMDSKRAIIGITQYPDGAGPGPRLFVKPGTAVTQAAPPANPDVVLWKDLRGRPVNDPSQPRIVRGQVVRDPEREQRVRDRVTELSGDIQDTTDTTTTRRRDDPAYQAAYEQGWSAAKTDDIPENPPEDEGWAHGFDDAFTDSEKWTRADRADQADTDAATAAAGRPAPTRQTITDAGNRTTWYHGAGAQPDAAGRLVTITKRDPRDDGTPRDTEIRDANTGDFIEYLPAARPMWLSPADDSTAGASAPDAEPAGARIGDRPAGDVAELLANPTATEERTNLGTGQAAERLTWDASLAAPNVVRTENIGGREVAIVQYRTLSKPTRDANPELGYDTQFHAVPADATFRPLTIPYATGDGYYKPGTAMSGQTVARMQSQYRNPHIASGKTAAAALSGARAKIEKDELRARYTPTAQANIGVHDRADFDALDPNAVIRPGDLVVLQSFGKLRTGVATKVTANKVDALVSTPSGAHDTWYGTAQKGIGVRLLHRADTPATAGPTPTPGIGAASTADTSAPAGPPPVGDGVSGDLTTDPTHVMSHSINAATASRMGGVRSFAQPNGTVRVVARSVTDGRIAYERGVAHMRNNFPGIDVPDRFEVRVRKTADRQPAEGSYRDERTGDVVVPLVADDAVDGPSTAGTGVPETPALSPDEDRAAVAGRVFAQTQLDNIAPGDTRFRMRRARVGNRELDLFDDRGEFLGTLHEQPGRDGWLTMPANGRAGVTASSFAGGVDSLRAGENAPETTPPAPARVVDPGQRRDLIADSLAGEQLTQLAEAVDTAIDKATPDDPADARKAALEAKRAELDTARAAAQKTADTPFGGSSKRKSFGVRVDANIRRTAEAYRTVDRLEREVKALERPPAPGVPKGGFTPEQLKGARVIKTRIGWHEVVKVNAKSVKVKAAPGMDDLVPIKRIIDARDNDGKRVDAPADAPAVDVPEVTDQGAPAPSITAGADPFALVGGSGSSDPLDDAFGTPPASTAGTSAPAVVVDAVNVDDEVRVAGQWATVTAKVGGQLRVRFPDNRLALVNPGDIRQHRPATRVDDMFGGTTTFVPQDRATIGVAARADVGRTRGQAAVQQVSMFDVADQVQHPDQGALLDAFLQMPTAEAPVSVPELPADAPEPTRVNVPDDLTSWTDEQLSGLFAEVSAQADYDEPGTLAILGEWERRESEMQAALGMVPDDLGTLDDDAAADLFALVTSHHGTMDTEQVARLEADLDRRDREHVAALADLDAKRALVALPADQHPDDDALNAALNAAGDLGDEDASVRILDEIDRRDQTQREREAAEAAEAHARQVADAQTRERAAAAAAAAANARELDAPAEARLIVLEDLIAQADDAEDAANSRDTPAEPGMADVSQSDLYATVITNLGSPEAEAAQRELQRRNAAEARSQQTLENRRARRRLLNRDLADLTDDELTGLPALLDTLPGDDGAAFRERKLADLRTEVTRRQQALDDKAARRAAGPDRSYRRADPVSEYDELEYHYMSRHGEDAGRWQEAKELALGLQRQPDQFSSRPRPVPHKEWKKAVQASPRPWPEVAQSALAWYRHLTEIDAPEQAETEGRARDFSTHGGWASQPDAPELLDPIAPADVAKADMVLYDMYRTAYGSHRNQQGDESTARRYVLAQARAYRIPHNRNASLAELNESGVSKKVGEAYARDPRSPQKAAADVIAEFRRLAAEDGVDPADSERFGPADRKSTARRAARGELTSDQHARIQALMARGLSLDQAYAQALGIDESVMRRQQADDLIRQTFTASNKDLAAAYRQAYTEHVMAAYQAAEEGTRGHLLNDAGKQLEAKGSLSAVELFSGSSTRAYKYASEELKRWWGEHPPPRLTFAEWKANMQGDPSAMAAAIQKAKGNEFA